jgi:hypothetical protein
MTDRMIDLDEHRGKASNESRTDAFARVWLERTIPSSFFVFPSASQLSPALSVFFAYGGACVIEPHAYGSMICRPFASLDFVGAYPLSRSPRPSGL